MELVRGFKRVEIGQRGGGGGVERHFVRALFDEARKLILCAEILKDGEAERGAAGVDLRRAEAIGFQPAADCGKGFDAGGGEAGLLVPAAREAFFGAHLRRARVILDKRGVHEEGVGAVRARQASIAAGGGVLPKPIEARIGPTFLGEEGFNLHLPVCVKSHAGEIASLRRAVPALLCAHRLFPEE